MILNFSAQLSPTPRGARLARLLATEQLRGWGLPLDPAEHIVAELATNAVTHGKVPGRDFRLTLYVVGGTLRIEVTDTRDDRVPHPQHPASDAESGRGLLLVDALADRWGVTPGLRPRKTVWAEVVLPPDFRNPCSGATGGLPQETREGKNPTKPHPSLPLAALPHPRE
ncbi:ATP-binding protein [Streptomyces fulvoviolaceus]|uniref:ATP-binding protein n=1 Tax=Streptomyces fulvoviolaceus TaxID=285535 RepID=UPI0021BF5820|nr:ATP-binding protein [Streptomyces fulvoviolaceus]MCT9080385.1 ATP-binding protein [Streptomyces fulvoviolaceus]